MANYSANDTLNALLISAPFLIIKAFIQALNQAIKAEQPNWGLSRIQCGWLGFCLMGIVITNSVCWAKFERAGLGRSSLSALSWMFRPSKFPWERLLEFSIGLILKRYGITEGCLALDDSDKRRSKVTSNIAGVHKLKDKASGGYMMGQCLIFLVLITPKVTIPVGFIFYEPDPTLSAWYQRNKQLKKAGIAAKQRPKKPIKNPNYPSKQALALVLLKTFEQHHPQINIKCVLADALYGSGDFCQKASAMFGNVQVISPLRSNQNIVYRGRKYSVESYFSKYPGTTQTIRIRGNKRQQVTVGSARLMVSAHGKKRFVIALKYEGEENYRYLVATDLTGRTLDITQAYTFRWLIEVFFSDWKAYEGWDALTKQPGEEGSSRSLILSLLVDHCLLLHPHQLAQVENKQPAYTVGSLVNLVKADSLLSIIQDLVTTDNPAQQRQKLAQQMEDNCPLNFSSKHMVDKDMGRLEPTPSLKYQEVA